MLLSGQVLLANTSINPSIYKKKKDNDSSEGTAPSTKKVVEKFSHSTSCYRSGTVRTDDLFATGSLMMQLYLLPLIKQTVEEY